MMEKFFVLKNIEIKYPKSIDNIEVWFLVFVK